MDLAINNVTDLCNFVGKMVWMCVCVYLEILSHFLPIRISLTNISPILIKIVDFKNLASPILIKIVDFKNLAWATSFATRASRKFIYLGKKVIVIPWTGLVNALLKTMHNM